jgi:hypothetical protein
VFVNEVVFLCERSEPLIVFKKRWSFGVFVSEEGSVGLASRRRWAQRVFSLAVSFVNPPFWMRRGANRPLALSQVVDKGDKEKG